MRPLRSIPKAHGGVCGVAADIQPETLLAPSICQGTMHGRTELIVPALSLRKDIPHEFPLKLRRNMSGLQCFAHSPAVGCVGILKAQRMAGQARRTQQLAQPLAIPGRGRCVECGPCQN